MLVPSIGNLLKAYDSQYRLVLDVAKLARKIASEIEESDETEKTVEKPVSLAIKHLENQKCPNNQNNN